MFFNVLKRGLLQESSWHKAMYAAALVAAVVMLCFSLWNVSGKQWIEGDNAWYHLPSALRLWGNLSFQYEEGSVFLAKFVGHPPLVHFLLGGMISLTGSIATINWSGIISFVLFFGAVKLIYRSDFHVPAALIYAMSIPLVFFHLNAGLIDLWMGALSCLGLICVERLIVKPHQKWVYLSLLLILALIYSKMIVWLFAALLGIATTLIIFIQCKKKMLRWRHLFIYVFFGALLAPIWPMYLWLEFGSIVYPYPDPFDPEMRGESVGVYPCEGFKEATHPWQLISMDDYFVSWTNFSRFWVSFFELTRFMSEEPMTYANTQHYGDLHYRMGGYNNLTMLCGVLMIAWAAYRHKALRVISAVFAVSLLSISFMQQAHELRYVMVIALTMIVIVGRLFAQIGDEGKPVLKGVLLPLGCFSTFIAIMGQFVVGVTLISKPAHQYSNRQLYNQYTHTPLVFEEYWADLDQYIAENGMPEDHPFCMPVINKNRTLITRDIFATCKMFEQQRALLAGPDMNTYPVYEGCESEEVTLAPVPISSPVPVAK